MDKFIRPNIRKLKAYTSARHENLNGVLLDANENPYDNEMMSVKLNRYPDPNQSALKVKLAERFELSTNQLTVTSGSDEAFDILFKTFTDAGDNIIVPMPTYGMYKVLADIFQVDIKATSMDEYYQPIIAEIETEIDDRSKAIFLCHPSNPIGNLIDRDRIKAILNLGLPTVIDEAYIDFSIADSAIDLLADYPNLIITRTLSKAYGLAGIRCGFMIASPYLTETFNAVKLPYNVNGLTLKVALEAMSESNLESLNQIDSEKKRLLDVLNRVGFVTDILPTVTNFVTFSTPLANQLYNVMKQKNVIIRRMSSIPNGIRITIGTPDEMKTLIANLLRFDQENNDAK